jgi:integrase-like protein
MCQSPCWTPIYSQSTAAIMPVNGQVERMNRTLKDATVKRYQYDGHDQLRTHLQLFVDAYNHARRLKTLRGLTPYEFICQVWTGEPDRFRLDPSHHIPGPYT